MSTAASLPYLAPLEDYRRQAEELRDALQSGSREARWRFKWEHPCFRGQNVSEVDPRTLDISDAQLVVAHQYGFETWADLVETPLHQAICAGHAEVVKLLVERGARLDVKDTIYRGTPLGWAIYCEQPEIADYLRARGAPAD